METSYVPWLFTSFASFFFRSLLGWAGLRSSAFLEAKICSNYRDQSNITPCLGSFVKVLKAVKHNAMSSNKACNTIIMTRVELLILLRKPNLQVFSYGPHDLLFGGRKYVYTSQLNKRKLASVGIEGTDKFCVKQQIYSYIFPQKSVLICQGLCQTASRWMTVIKWLCQRTSIISLILNILVSEINHDTCVALAGFHSPVNSYLPSPFWEKSEINESIFKMTEDAISFLRCENKTQIKPPCNWQDKMKRFIYLGDDSFFVR